MRRLCLAASLILAVSLNPAANAQTMTDHMMHSATGHAHSADDTRQLVALPAPMTLHMLGNMRDHLRAIEEILVALGQNDVDTAAKVAEQRLGLSSLDDHGAATMAPMMPEDMRTKGTAMHQAASRFVIAAEDAAVDDSPEKRAAVFTALGEITAACNACHMAYRIH